MGTALRVIGKPMEALSCYEQALTLARERKHLVDESVWLGNMGNCYQDMGQTMKAINCNQQSLALKDKVGSYHGLAETLGNLGNCYGDLGETEHSIDYHKKALNVARKISDKHSEGLILSNLADMLIYDEKYNEAIEYANEGLKIGEELNSPMICIYNFQHLATANLYSGNLQSARTASEKTGQYNVPEFNHTCLAVLGAIVLSQNEKDLAKEIFDKTIAQSNIILKESPQHFQAWDSKGIALSGLTLCENVDHSAAAIEAFDKARRINSDKGIIHRALRFFDALASLDKEGKIAEVRRAMENS
jgi:tetratricopeptide (TPR) repeat protein